MTAASSRPRRRLLVPLPLQDFDTTEVVVPWQVFSGAGWEVVFATPDGTAGATDPLLLTGVIFGQLGAEPPVVAAYAELEQEPGFVEPLPFADLEAEAFDALLLPGGHAPGMRPYLESTRLREVVQGFFAADKPVGAICHGPLVLVRTPGLDGQPSIVTGRTLTALPRWMELLAWGITAWKLGRYYRTYDTPVQDELSEALGPEGRYERGPLSMNRSRPFVVRDGKLITARWPGDALGFAEAFLELAEAEG